MKIRCKKTEGYQFSNRDVKLGVVNLVEHKALTKDKCYVVYGMTIFQEGLDYLIYDDYDMPMWYSAEEFIVEEAKLSNCWYHSFWGFNEFGITAIWGYKELVTDKEHYNGLSEQNSEDVEIYLKRKTEIEENE